MQIQYFTELSASQCPGKASIERKNSLISTIHRPEETGNQTGSGEAWGRDCRS